MAGEDLVFNILARDRNARATFKSVGDAAEHAGGQIAKLSTAAAALGSLGGATGAAAGGLLALPAAATAGAAALGTLAVAVHGVGDAISSIGDAEFVESMEKLSPAARSFVGELDRVNQGLKGMRSSTQDAFFGPLLGSFDQLTTAYLPTLDRQLPQLSASLGRAAASWVDVVSAGENVSRVDRILTSAGKSTESFGKATGTLTTSFLRLGDSGSSAVERLSAGLARGAETFDRFIAKSQADGSLARGFDMAATAAGGLADAVTPVLASLYELGTSSGAQQGLENLVTILGNVSGTVSGLVNAFAALPDGMQSTLITLGAMGLAASKFVSVGQGIVTWASESSKALERFGTVGEKAGKGLNAAAGGIGKVGGALMAMQIAGAALGSSVNPQIDSLTRNMAAWAKTGKAGGEAARLFGDNLEMLNYDLSTLATDGATKAVVGIMKVGDVLGLGGLYDKSMQHAEERLSSYDQALTQMVQGGQVEAAGQAFARIGQLAQQQGISVEELAARFPMYKAALEGANSAQLAAIKTSQEQKAEQNLLNGSWEEAIRLLGGFKSAHDALNGVAMNHVQADIAMKQGQLTLTEALKKSEGAWGDQTEAGLANMDMALKQIQTITAAADAQERQSAKTKDAATAAADGVAVWNTGIQSIRAAATQAGIAAPIIDAFINMFSRVPKTVAPQISTPGAKESQAEVDKLEQEILTLKGKQVDIKASGIDGAEYMIAELQRKIDALRGKTIQINTQIFEQRTYSSAAEFSQTRGYRWGGIAIPAQRGLVNADVYPAGSRPLYQFAEPQTGGEAFVPKRGNRTRSLDILSQAAGWYDASVVPNGGGGGGGSPMLMAVLAQLASAISQGMAVSHTVRADGSPLAEELARYIKSNPAWMTEMMRKGGWRGG